MIDNDAGHHQGDKSDGNRGDFARNPVMMPSSDDCRVRLWHVAVQTLREPRIR